MDLIKKQALKLAAFMLFSFGVFVNSVAADQFNCSGQVVNGYEESSAYFKVFGHHKLQVETCAGHIPVFMCDQILLGGTKFSTSWNEVAKHWRWGPNDGFFNPKTLRLTYRLPSSENTGNASADQRWFVGKCEQDN